MTEPKQTGQKLLAAAGCVVCALVCLRSFLVFEGTEFGGGSLAGNQVLSALLFLVALILTFKFSRMASIIPLVASYFSLPLYLYLVFPRPFRQVWRGNWSNPVLPRETFVWNGWWVAGILVTTLVIFWCVVQLVRSFRARTLTGVWTLNVGLTPI